MIQANLAHGGVVHFNPDGTPVIPWIDTLRTYYAADLVVRSPLDESPHWGPVPAGTPIPGAPANQRRVTSYGINTFTDPVLVPWGPGFVSPFRGYTMDTIRRPASVVHFLPMAYEGDFAGADHPHADGWLTHPVPAFAAQKQVQINAIERRAGNPGRRRQLGLPRRPRGRDPVLRAGDRPPAQPPRPRPRSVSAATAFPTPRTTPPCRQNLSPFALTAVAMAAVRDRPRRARRRAARSSTPTATLHRPLQLRSNEVVSTKRRVFEGEFDAFGIVDEPGFNALSGTSPGIPAGFSALPGNTPVTFTAKAFRHAGATSQPVALGRDRAGELRPGVRRPPRWTSSDRSSRRRWTVRPSDATGFTIGTTSPTGLLHQHISFQINDGDTNPLVQSADAGFYLWSLEMSVGAGLNSEPLFFVHGLGDHPESLHEAAIDFVSARSFPSPPPYWAWSLLALRCSPAAASAA